MSSSKAASAEVYPALYSSATRDSFRVRVSAHESKPVVEPCTSAPRSVCGLSCDSAAQPSACPLALPDEHATNAAVPCCTSTVHLWAAVKLLVVVRRPCSRLGAAG